MNERRLQFATAFPAQAITKACQPRNDDTNANNNGKRVRSAKIQKSGLFDHEFR
jgi:hypothetical protein